MAKTETVPSPGPAAQTGRTRPEDVSLLVDGELDTERLDGVCSDLRNADRIATWTCYHVIGDVLRGASVATPGFHARFAKRLATEPTVLAPPTRTRPAAIAWAAAATVAAVAVVGWVSMETMPVAPTVVATARQASAVRPADAHPFAVDNEYLLAHQEYSPTNAIQGVRPYLRAVVAEDQDASR